MGSFFFSLSPSSSLLFLQQKDVRKIIEKRELNFIFDFIFLLGFSDSNLSFFCFGNWTMNQYEIYLKCDVTSIRL